MTCLQLPASCHYIVITLGVSLQSFVGAYTVAMSPFNVFLASPEVITFQVLHADKLCGFLVLQGGHPVYIGGDESSQRWIKDFKQQLVAVPEKLENIDCKLWVCVCVCVVCV